jgi:predicted 3-demethylubiquinone-9 3-methyltransferase (glyoxalase superfamily)
MQKITPCLWFDGNAEQAVSFYTSIFKNSKVVSVTRCGEAGPWPKGTVLVMYFQLEGLDFIALNGGPQFKFSEAISLQIFCDTQDEVDYFWSKLSEGGEEGPCGWLKDKFGLSWQVVPSRLSEMLRDPNSKKVERVTAAFLQMKKFDLAALDRAYHGA